MTWKLQLTSLEVRTTLLEEKENLHQENIQLRNKLHKAEQAIMTLKHARKKNLKSFQTETQTKEVLVDTYCSPEAKEDT